MSHFGELLNNLWRDTAHGSLYCFGPELSLCVTIVVLLLLRLCGGDRVIPPYLTALVGSLITLFLAGSQLLVLQSEEVVPTPFFTGMLMFDHLGAYIRGLLALFLVLVIALTVLSGIPDRQLCHGGFPERTSSQQ